MTCDLEDFAIKGELLYSYFLRTVSLLADVNARRLRSGDGTTLEVKLDTVLAIGIYVGYARA